MTFRRLIKQNSNDNYILGDRRKSGRYPAFSVNRETDNKRLQTLATLGTLPRGRKQLTRCRSNSLVDYTDSPRTIIVLEKQDNETFGFEIQTYGLQHQNSNSLEMCTFICKVHEDSPAEAAGLTTGDIIVSINGIRSEGFSHQHTVDLIKASSNCLRLETINGTAVKRIELEAKLQFLQQTLQEKWVEFRKLLLQEQRLAQGNLNECNPQDTLESLSSPTLSVDAGSATFSPALRIKHRFSSGSSCKSQLSVMTDDSDDQHYVFEDLATSPCRRGSVDDECFFPRDSNAMGEKASVTRTRSISLASSNSGSGSPSWVMPGNAGLFGTLPRKMKRGSVKKRLLKFIPGLNHSVEEEETH
ncbi:Cytohesin-interacting protein [Acipenser ruthenus]|uniref:Cytohesin-interacting protein n=1 Tax=Acipenser ruthenus TaxID=7906 RepID=A0A444U8R5_ACIRT|nr:cytohesin-interacting protein [Acipenser ruthenus]RXM31544.1 Cytohesin-interacting protein [Acipenser ruthenus]